MSLTLGEKLRQAREERGISISEVAEQTRISPHYLDLIEQDDYRTLPGGIFNKGFVKSYAKYVGLDEQEALQDYAHLIVQQEGTVDESPKTYRPEVLTDDRASSTTIPTIVFAVIILGLMVWGLLTIVRYFQDNQNQPINATNTTANTNQVNTNPTNTNNPQPLPATDKISVELKAVGDDIWLTYWLDATEKVTTMPRESSLKDLNAQKSFRLKFPKDKARNLQLLLNGKPISLPTSPANPKRNNIELEITKENTPQILQSGQITLGGTNTANTNAAVPR